MKVLIVDDHVLFREGLVSLLNSDPTIMVVGEAGSVREAVEQSRRLKPDLILMDFSLPDGDGAEASAIILAEMPECKIIFLTMYETDEKLFAAIRSGAKGYLLKNVPISKLMDALKAIEKGEAAISRTMTMRILDEFSHTRNDERRHPLLENLSPRELDVLRELSSGGSNNEIADRLFLSVNTVKHHIHNILSKLNLENRHEAISFARKNGVVNNSSG
jgi:two-component system nitrate/nitrite response regulator NarL